MSVTAISKSSPEAPSSAAIFLAFLRLGLTSFGGPVAHLGYFRTEFVQRRKWLSDHAFADIVALCQLLPGPASSQTGIAIGLMKGGLSGAADVAGAALGSGHRNDAGSARPGLAIFHAARCRRSGWSGDGRQNWWAWAAAPPKRWPNRKPARGRDRTVRPAISLGRGR